ncbi:hypothetical protein BGZ93_000310 [Podila epicladia]|nr:hypothetical protein BGZ93_000310 [Podila epicladia]
MALLSFPQLPLELIIHISNFIDNSTLVIFLRICRAWHNLLRPLCYRTISRTQWHHPHFPLRDLAHLSDAALAPLLGQIHSFEWFSNEALTTGGVIDTRRRKKQLEGESQFILRSQVPLQQLTRMLAMMASTLVHLRIEDWWWGYTKSQVSAILPFKRLTSLSLTFPSHYELVPLLELKSWISLLSRLEKLEIGGLPQMFVVNDATRSEIRSVSTHPWPMKTLKVPTCQISWIEFCPRLQELEIDHTFSHYHSLSGSITPATTPLDTWCPELEILRLAGWFGKEHSYQQGLVIASLKRLKSLTLIKRLYEDNFDFLMPGNQLGDEKIENLPCPMLEHLESAGFYYGHDPSSRALWCHSPDVTLE